MRDLLAERVRRRLDPDQRYGLRLTLLVFAGVLVAVPFGLLLVQVLSEGPMVRADTAAANHLHGWVRGSETTVTVLKVITALGTPLFFYIVCGGVAIYLWRQNRHRLAVFLVSTSLLGGLVDTVVKIVVDRERPSLEDPVATAHGQSFPSGHAMTSTICYGALLLIFLPMLPPRRRPLAIASTIVLVLVIGATRLALGVHYISDVVGGIVLGTAWLAACTAVFEIWRQDLGVRPTEPLEEGLTEPAVS